MELNIKLRMKKIKDIKLDGYFKQGEDFFKRGRYNRSLQFYCCFNVSKRECDFFNGDVVVQESSYNEVFNT